MMDEHVVTIDGPLTAEAIVDAHLAARAAGKPLRILHAGAPSAVALRTAARFGATLVDTAGERAPVVSVTPPAVETREETKAPEPRGERAPAGPAPLRSLVDEGSPALPWDPAMQAPEPAPVVVPEDEFEAMPWNVVDNVLLPAGRQTRAAGHRPTLTSPDWGLPWPRPMAPMDGLAKVDPAIWKAPERIQAIRDDLERSGAPSFGVAKPEGSAWLKRLSEFGSP